MTNLQTNEIYECLESFKKWEDWKEIWNARDLQKILGYSKWENFAKVLDKAQVSCKESKQAMWDHFLEISKPVRWWKWAVQHVQDYLLSRYACYLIAQNWDPRKSEIAYAQTYFALQTRKQEIIEKKFEEIERLKAKEKLQKTQSQFQWLAFERWISWDWILKISQLWDKVLFWWKDISEMKKRMKLDSKDMLDDFLPTVTLKAKDLATEVTNHNIVHNGLYWEELISAQHESSNKWVRNFLSTSWIKPEKLPAEENLKKIENKRKAESSKFLNK